MSHEFKSTNLFFSRIRRTHDVPSILVKEWKISQKLWRLWFGTPIFSSVGHGGSKKIIGFPEHITSRSLSGVETSQLEHTLVHGRLSSRYTWFYYNNNCPMLTSKLQCHIVFLHVYSIHLFCLDTNFSILDNHISDTINIRFVYPNTKLPSFRLNPGDFGSVGDFAASSELAFGGGLWEIEETSSETEAIRFPFFKILDDPIVGGVKDILLGGDFFEPRTLGKGSTSNHQLSSLGWENSEGAGCRMMLGCFNCSL